MSGHGDFNSVGTAPDGDVVLVGEEHGNRRGSDLARRVLDDTEPVAVGLEHSQSRRGAMHTVHSYGNGHGLPTKVIDDKSLLHEERRNGNTPNLYRVANTFREPVTENGDVPQTSIDSTRRAVYELYGESVYDAMYTAREDHMAEQLRGLVNEYGGPVVGCVGAFHLQAIQERLQ